LLKSGWFEMDINPINTGFGKARISINLRPHIDAYHQQREYEQAYVELKLAHKHRLKESIYDFDIFADKALENFDGTKKRMIKNSPAYFFMRRQFAESLKNSIDSVLSYHEDDPSHPKDTVELDLNISLIRGKQEEINITLSDNGVGFPPAFLEKIRTKARREGSDYYHQAATNKPVAERLDRKKHRLFMGGAGQGLAELAGLVDKGNPKFGREKGHGEHQDGERQTDGLAENTTYELPKKSELVFSNKCETSDEHGAVISITTSKDPIKTHITRLSIAISDDEVITLPPMNKRRFGKKSPVTVTVIDENSPTENITFDMRNKLNIITSEHRKGKKEGKKDDDEINQQDRGTPWRR